MESPFLSGLCDGQRLHIQVRSLLDSGRRDDLFLCHGTDFLVNAEVRGITFVGENEQHRADQSYFVLIDSTIRSSYDRNQSDRRHMRHKKDRT